MTKINRKIHGPRSFNEAINNPIHGWHCRKAIKEELQNLENHQIWEDKELPPRKKAIGSTWVLKVEYHPDNLVARFKARLVTQGFF